MTTSSPAEPAGTQTTHLKRTLGLPSVLLFGLAYMAPLIVYGTYGVLAGASPTVNLPMILMRAIRIQGVTLGSLADMRAMVRAMAVNGLRPVIDRTFAFDALDAAFAHYRRGDAFGKIVVRTG